MRCFRPALRARTPIIEALESRHLLSATPQLLADINTQASGIPREFIEFNGRLYYQAYDQDHGGELWSSDGTPEGTYLVKDINPGPSNSGPSRFVPLGDYLYFAALTTSSGIELWRTDGTESGTQMVRETGLSITEEIRELNGSLYFLANPGSGGPNLWKSDGTFEGTVMVQGLGLSTFGQATELTVVGDKLFLIANNNDIQGPKLWKSDGTTSGTSVVKDFGQNGLTNDTFLLTDLNGTLYFRANDLTSKSALWKSDGTPAGTVKLAIPENNFLANADSLTVVGSRLFFAGNSAAAGTELWSSDGTAAGTQLVSDLASGTASFSPSNLSTVDDTLYFTGIRDGKYELWNVASGTSSPLRLAALEKNGLPLEISAMTEFEGELYFTAFSDVFGADLWRSNGTPLGTFPWRAQIAPAGSIWPFEMGTAAGRMFFTANVGGTGMELWSTDGTFGGTGILADLGWYVNDASRPQDFVTAGDFTANDGTGRHLFSTPGPSGPVTRLTASAYEVQSADVEQLVPVGSELYFVARDTFGRQYLGLTSGTTQTTQVLAWPFDADQIQIEGLAQFAAGVMFLVKEDTLGLLVCKADAGGTKVIGTLNPDWSLPTTPEAIVAQGVYYFVAAGVEN